MNRIIAFCFIALVGFLTSCPSGTTEPGLTKFDYSHASEFTSHIWEVQSTTTGSIDTIALFWQDTSRFSQLRVYRVSYSMQVDSMVHATATLLENLVGGLDSMVFKTSGSTTCKHVLTLSPSQDMRWTKSCPNNDTITLAPTLLPKFQLVGFPETVTLVMDSMPCGRYGPENRYQLYRGPKGGCYYINSNGNKSYIDRSDCNCIW